MPAAKPFDPDRFCQIYEALHLAQKNPDLSRSQFMKAKDLVPDFDEMEIVDVNWRIYAMQVANKNGMLDDWIIRREDEEDDIHSAVLDVVATFPLNLGELFEAEPLQEAIRDRFRTKYGCEA